MFSEPAAQGVFRVRHGFTVLRLAGRAGAGARPSFGCRTFGHVIVRMSMCGVRLLVLLSAVALAVSTLWRVWASHDTHEDGIEI